MKSLKQFDYSFFNKILKCQTLKQIPNNQITSPANTHFCKPKILADVSHGIGKVRVDNTFGRI